MLFGVQVCFNNFKLETPFHLSSWGQGHIVFAYLSYKCQHFRGVTGSLALRNPLKNIY